MLTYQEAQYTYLCAYIATGLSNGQAAKLYLHYVKNMSIGYLSSIASVCIGGMKECTHTSSPNEHRPNRIYTEVSRC
jgi:hypothetical protein